MGRYAQLVLGPAGSGKSTYCGQLHVHCESVGRRVHIINLDPAAERFDYPVTADIRDLICLEEVMEDMKLGPNGGLLYCMEFLEDNAHEWLQEVLDSFGEDDYVVFDCPGQIELYSHSPVLRSVAEKMKLGGWSIAAVYMLDSQFVTDAAKFISGCMAALSAMMQLELPHVNVLTKMDLLKEKRALVEQFLQPDATLFAQELQHALPGRYRRLNHAIAALIDDYSLVSFLPLDLSKEESIAYVLQHIDGAIQYGEDADVRTSSALDD